MPFFRNSLKLLFSLDSFSLPDFLPAQHCPSSCPLPALRRPLEGPCLPTPSEAEAMSTGLFILSSVITTWPAVKGWGRSHSGDSFFCSWLQSCCLCLFSPSLVFPLHCRHQVQTGPWYWSLLSLLQELGEGSRVSRRHMGWRKRTLPLVWGGSRE